MLTACLMSACSSTRHVHVWNERYAVAARAHDRGELEVARGHYDELLAHAPDDASRRLIAYRLALMLEEQGSELEALAAYRDIYESEVSEEYVARALYRASRLVARRDGAPAAQPMYHELLERHGDWVVAEHAVAWIASHEREQGGSQAALDALLVHREHVRGKSVEGDYLMEVAKLYESVGRRAETVTTYGEVLGAMHLEVWWDDALWELSELYQREGAWVTSIGVLEDLATEYQEDSYFIGDYSSEHADNARYEMGRIYLEELDQPEEAVAQFDQFLKDFKTNRLRDDAAWMRLRALKRAGDTRRYEKELKQFSKDFPESRYVRRLNEGELP